MQRINPENEIYVENKLNVKKRRKSLLIIQRITGVECKVVSNK